MMKSQHMPPANRKTGETFQSQPEGLRDRGPLVYTLVSEGRIHQAWGEQAGLRA